MSFSSTDIEEKTYHCYPSGRLMPPPLPDKETRDAQLRRQLETFDEILSLEPLLDHPEFFTSDHRLTEDELAPCPKLQEKFRALSAEVAEELKTHDLRGLPPDEIYRRRRDEYFNPFRVNKLGDLLTLTEYLLDLEDNEHSSATLELLKGKQDVADLRSRIVELRSTLAEKKSDKTMVETAEAKASFNIGKIGQRILNDFLSEPQKNV